jgi:hypothetical protein
MRQRPIETALTGLSANGITALATLPNQIAAWVLATLGSGPQERAQTHRHFLRRVLRTRVPRRDAAEKNTRPTLNRRTESTRGLCIK